MTTLTPALLLLLGFVSCAATQEAPPRIHLPAPPTSSELRDLATIRGDSGERASWDEVVGATLQADIVLFAELHGHPVGLPFHAAIFADSLGRDDSAALCLEFVTRDWQYLLDAWAAGIVDWDAVEETLASAPGSTATPHKPLIDLAHAAQVPVFAANSPRIYTRAAKASGYETLAALSPEQQRLFQIPGELPSGPYRDGFYEMMAGFEEGHGAEGDTESDVALEPAEPVEPSEALVAKFRAQALWDGTMADTVLQALDSGAGRAFLAVGCYHANNDGGIVQVLRQRRPDAKVVVISFVAEGYPGPEAIPTEYLGMADFVTFAGPFPDFE